MVAAAAAAAAWALIKTGGLYSWTDYLFRIFFFQSLSENKKIDVLQSDGPVQMEA